jgi:hypothetical protein
VERYFTPAEANDALAEVRPLAERMVQLQKKLLEAQAREEQLGAKVAGNGGGIDLGEAAKAQAAIEAAVERLAAAVDAIVALGVQVKDLDTGLLDFPSLREGEEVLLCWQLGEERVEWWHRPEDGYAGRRPL